MKTVTGGKVNSGMTIDEQRNDAYISGTLRLLLPNHEIPKKNFSSL